MLLGRVGLCISQRRTWAYSGLRACAVACTEPSVSVSVLCSLKESVTTLQTHISSLENRISLYVPLLGFRPGLMVKILVYFTFIMIL